MSFRLFQAFSLGAVSVLAMWIQCPSVSHAETEPMESAERRGRMASEHFGSDVTLAFRILQQHDWRYEEPSRTGIGLGVSAPLSVYHVGRWAFGLEPAVELLFREGMTLLPVELRFIAELETETFVQPFFGLGPVLNVDFGKDEVSAAYGASLSFGAAFFATRRFGVSIDGTYRWLGGKEFQQQLILSLGPFISL
jgi:hypothetical protein